MVSLHLKERGTAAFSAVVNGGAIRPGSLRMVTSCTTKGYKDSLQKKNVKFNLHRLPA
jgi:hypothetical protein